MAELTLTPEIMEGISLSEETADLMKDVLGEEGFKLWATPYQPDVGGLYYGSGYYIELPYYINRLLAPPREKEARAVLERAFAGCGIPGEDWRKMVNYREKGILE